MQTIEQKIDRLIYSIYITRAELLDYITVYLKIYSGIDLFSSQYHENKKLYSIRPPLDSEWNLESFQKIFNGYKKENIGKKIIQEFSEVTRLDPKIVSETMFNATLESIQDEYDYDAEGTLVMFKMISLILNSELYSIGMVDSNETIREFSRLLYQDSLSSTWISLIKLLMCSSGWVKIRVLFSSTTFFFILLNIYEPNFPSYEKSK